MRNGYGFLADLDDDERQLAAARGQDRPLALKLLTERPDALLAGQHLYRGLTDPREQQERPKRRTSRPALQTRATGRRTRRHVLGVTLVYVSVLPAPSGLVNLNFTVESVTV